MSPKKKAAARSATGQHFLEKIPYLAISATLLIGTFITMIAWIVIIDNPGGGLPSVTVRIIEPKFDSKDRDVALVSVTKPPLDQPAQQPGELVDLVPSQPDGLTPINPDDVLIYDPSKVASTNNIVSLSTVADKNLIEKSRYGFLPRISETGEKPILAYSRPSNAIGARKSQIAIIIGGLGLNEATTQASIADLPPETTLAFAPYANNLFDWMERARSKGHELLLQLPLEPFDYPNNDPGPKTLLVDETWETNEDRLHWILSRMTNYVGLVNYMGARFSASPDSMRLLFNTLRDRGLLYVDNGSTPLSRANEIADETKIPYAQSSLVLDSLLSANDIDARLLELESLAREKGSAIGIASAFPVTIERLKRWAVNAERRGIKLIPISATLDKTKL